MTITINNTQFSTRSPGPSLNISRQLSALSLPPFQGIHSTVIVTAYNYVYRLLMPGRQHSGIDVSAIINTFCFLTGLLSGYSKYRPHSNRACSEGRQIRHQREDKC